MKFETIDTKKYYSLNEIKKDQHRKDLWDNYEDTLYDLKQEMFDRWNVENIYIYGDILDKDKYIVDDINLFVEISQKEFDDMVDSFYIQENNLFNFTFLVDKEVYNYKDNIWNNNGRIPDYKIML